MKFVRQPKVSAKLNEESEKNINSVNEYMDRLKGTVISVNVIHSGQTGPYQDSLYEAVIFCHLPNSLTTNAPLVRTISEEQAKTIARIFLCDFSDNPEDWASPRLVYVRPEKNPCGLEENSDYFRMGYHSCWRVQIHRAYTG